MSSPTTPFTKNFGLSEQAFAELLQALRQGDEQLFEQVFVSYFEPCMAFLKLKYKAGHSNAYDATMWSLLHFRQLLVDGKVAYGNLEAYFLRMAISRYLKEQGANKEIPTEFLPELTNATEESMADAETLDILAKAWNKLGELCQKLLKGFYYDKTDLKTLTILLSDSSESNTRKRKERCIKELRKHFFELE